MISRGLKMPGRQLSSTESSVDSTWSRSKRITARERLHLFLARKIKPNEPRLHGVGFTIKNSLHNQTPNKWLRTHPVPPSVYRIRLRELAEHVRANKTCTMKNSTPSSTVSPTLNTCSCWGTSMPGLVMTMIHCLPALDTMALGK